MKDINSYQLQLSEEQFIKSFNGLDHWRINKSLVKKLGINATLFLTNLLSKWFFFKREGKLTEDGFFYNIQKQIEEETTLSPYQQREALFILAEHKLIEHKRMGLSPKSYYRMILENLFALLDYKPAKLPQEIRGRTLKNLRYVPQKIKGTYLKKLRNEIYNKENNSFLQKEETKVSSFSKSKKELMPFAEQRAIEDRRERLRTRMKEEVESSKKPNLVSVQAKGVIDLWRNTCEGKFVQHKEDTQRFFETARMIDRMLNGSFFDNNETFARYKGYKFREEDFKEAFIKLGKTAFDPDYEPEIETSYKKYFQKITLKNFLYNGASNGTKHKSLFIYFHENSLKLLSQRQRTPINTNTPCMKMLIKRFCEITRIKEVDLTTKQLKDLSFAENRLYSFLEENRGSIIDFDYWKSMYDCRDDVSLLAVFLVKALEERGEKTIDIHSGWFCSDKTFKERLPHYLRNTGLLKAC